VSIESGDGATAAPLQPESPRAKAERVLARWRSRGFDRVTCYPSGYCCPANSSAGRAELRAGYRALPIDSEEALAAVAASIEGGMSYRV
jgi:hypothetical protein